MADSPRRVMGGAGILPAAWHGHPARWVARASCPLRGAGILPGATTLAGWQDATPQRR